MWFRCSAISAVALSAFFVGSGSSASATEYFVGPLGCDLADGRSREASFATVQRGVDALQPGDVLTIAPGEYSGSVNRVDLGGPDRTTVIRAEIPGTVTLRGDVAAPVFRRAPGRRSAYVGDFSYAGPLPAVVEVDTLTILKRMPNVDELEFIPGTFHHDAAAGKLYVATSDMRPIESHKYRVSVVATHGLHLVRPRRVTIEGLAATGFGGMGLLHYREGTLGGVWGFFLSDGQGCSIRDCRAYLNAWGVGLNSGAAGAGDNVVERCEAWANKSPFLNGDMGGISLFAARRDVVRDSTAYLNGMYGVNLYGTGGAPPNADDGGNDPRHRSLLEGVLAWGNETADIKIKTGYEYHHVARRCVAPGLWSVTNVDHGTIGRGAARTPSAAKAAAAKPGEPIAPSNDILLADEETLDSRAEFADPDHHDYRLQSTSRFRGAGVAGSDRGAFAYAANVFFVAPEGDDQADGLSVAGAWKTWARATSRLRPGDTIYLAPGEYSAAGEIRAPGRVDAPISVRSRGEGDVRLRGVVACRASGHLKFERLTFLDGAKVDDVDQLAFDNCEFQATDTALIASRARGLTIRHCLFRSFGAAARSAASGVAVALDDCSAVDLRGVLFDNVRGPAIRLADHRQIRYADYNSYRDATRAWDLAGSMRSLDDVRSLRDSWAPLESQSQEIVPEFATSGAAGANKNPGAEAKLVNAPLFAAVGPFGKPAGRYRDEPRRQELRLVVPPHLFSTSATTANLEWTTSRPATCRLAWGPTPDCDRTASFHVNCFGSYSLTGLQPGTKYYFRIAAIETPADYLPKAPSKAASMPPPQSVALDDEPLEFVTPRRDAEPAVYYVAVDGDDAARGTTRQTAWRTISHAAARVNVGDTVLIAGGKYVERIRIRATGESGRPITFRSLPGERVELNGADLSLGNAFVACGKSHLRFDGLYLTGFNLFPNDKWSLENSGEFLLYAGRDVEIGRCFSEGRGGYSAPPVAAYEIDGLTIKNCVNTYKFGGMYFWRCPNLVIENTVFAEPMIMAFVLRNAKTQKATLRNCIFTDMLEKKAKLNLGVLCCDGETDGFECRNDCFFLRDCIPLEQRVLQGSQTAAQLGRLVVEPLFADPLFAGDPGVKGDARDKSGFSPDRMMDAKFPADFDTFFATNPELIRRDIGLQPAAFRDFRFQKPGEKKSE